MKEWRDAQKAMKGIRQIRLSFRLSTGGLVELPPNGEREIEGRAGTQHRLG